MVRMENISFNNSHIVLLYFLPYEQQVAKFLKLHYFCSLEVCWESLLKDVPRTLAQRQGFGV
jgi:hypothetical protein